ncbi:3-hydroxyisobutyrate dehydrogenase-like beta-hydroxyacid dehydrogenase [Aequitasia blattaphilus]|uniref:NAD(P)-dependent oxidoreductase n=1 Tax=Aequitasia blattaphilus TaxID=2949332 RepID=A0ABT1EAT0_9FIRM|nr:NAD(P)-dependent oxidoreductase [Aequitasia blattaphilus]MCP1102940.1 NAD(P)-dependent oxidoreductase [Aequitasia blattaphilus]MCR8615580.1 NAD(P)-dependent oxidoreductase [Aequitasia blattaphilus]
MAKIGWIGLGNMGNPMSQNLLKAGHEVTVWNRTKSKADEVLAAGAKWADSPKAVTEASDVIFTMVSNGPTLHAVNFGDEGVVAGLASGKIVIDMSTVAPSESAAVNDAIEAKGCKFLKCPVTGSTALAQNATLGVLGSGDKASFDEVTPLLACMSAKQTYFGAGEEARVLKLAINSILAAQMQLFAEGIVLCEKAGLDVAEAGEAIAGSAVGSPLYGYKHKMVAEGQYAPAFSANMMIKDLDLAFDAAKQYNAAMPTVALTRQSLQAAVATDKGDLDFAVLTKVLEESCGITR